MKTYILFRIALVPIKVLALVLAVLFIVIPCDFINEEDFGDRILDWIKEFGNYKTER